MKKTFMLLSIILIVALFLISCAPQSQVPEEEALAQLDGLSDEERDAALVKSGALAGQAYKLLPSQSVEKVKQVRQVAKSFKWLECFDTEGEVNNKVAGIVKLKYTYGGGPVKEISYADMCQQGDTKLVEYYCKGKNYATLTADCQYGCESIPVPTGVPPMMGRCKEAPAPLPLEPGCGDGKVEGNEQCDDGNKNNLDFCKNDCTTAFCGDGVVYPDVENCDDGNKIDGDACKNNCAQNWCGDKVVYIGVEQCDDGNELGGDGCSALCQTEVKKVLVCGNGQLDGQEECDDPAGDSSGSFSKNCVGLGYNGGLIKCSANYCKFDTSQCNKPGVVAGVCGNDVINTGEVCDGNDLGGWSCFDYEYNGGLLQCNSNCKNLNTSLCNKPDCAVDYGPNYKCYTQQQWADAGSPVPVREVGCSPGSEEYGYCAPKLLPDLVVTDISYTLEKKIIKISNESDESKEHTFVDVTITVKNIGTAGTVNWFSARPSSVPVSAAKIGDSYFLISNNLAAGEQTKAGAQGQGGQFKYECFADHTLTVSVDDGSNNAYKNRVAESNENNNMKSISVDC